MACCHFVEIGVQNIIDVEGLSIMRVQRNLCLFNFTSTLSLKYASLYFLFSLFCHFVELPEIAKSFLAVPLLVLVPCGIGLLFIRFVNQLNYRSICSGKLSFICLLKFLFITFSIGLVFLTICGMFLSGIGLLHVSFYALFMLFLSVCGFLFSDVDIPVNRCSRFLLIFLGLMILQSVVLFVLRTPNYLLLPEFDHFRFNAAIIRLFERGFLSQEYPYLSWLPLLFAITAYVLNIDAFCLFWSGTVITHFFFCVVIFFFVYYFTRNYRIAFLSAFFAPWFVWSKTCALYRFIPQTIFYIVFPVVFVTADHFFTRAMASTDRKYSTIGLSFCVLFFALYLTLPLKFSLLDLQFYPIWRAMILPLFIIVSYAAYLLLADRKHQSHFLLFLLVLSLLMTIHVQLTALFIIVILAFWLFRLIDVHLSSKIKFILLFVVSSIILIGIFLRLFDNFSIIPSPLYNPEFQFYNITFDIKLKILITVFTPIFLILSILGAALSLERLQGAFPLVFTFIFIHFLYFPRPPVLARSLFLFTPFVCLFSAFVLVYLSQKSKSFLFKKVSTFRTICFTSIIALLSLSLCLSLTQPTLTLIENIRYVGGLTPSDYLSFYNYDELLAAKWLKSHLDGQFVIVSDPETQLIFYGLTGWQHIGETVAVTDYGRTILRQIFLAASPEESFRLIKWIVNHNLTESYVPSKHSFFKKRIIDRYRAQGYSFELKNKPVLLVITGRTIRFAKGLSWFGPDENINYIGSNCVYVSRLSDLLFVKKFFDTVYFTPLYILEGRIYIFKVNFNSSAYPKNLAKS